MQWNVGWLVWVCADPNKAEERDLKSQRTNERHFQSSQSAKLAKKEGTEQTVKKRFTKVALRNGEIEIKVIVADTGGNHTRVSEKLRIK